MLFRSGRGGSNAVDDPTCPERLGTQRTLLGTEQENWLYAGLAASRARWNILAQQLLMAQTVRKPGPERKFWSDGWDGYPAARTRLLQAIAGQRPANPLVIGGDVHFNCVSDLRVDFDDTQSPAVATEFCGTSISSQGQSQARLDALRAENPHVRFANGEKRGYVVMDLAARRCLAELRVIDSEKAADSPVSTLATFVVEDGRPGAEAA